MNRACRLLLWSLLTIFIGIGDSANAQDKIAINSKELGAAVLKTGTVSDVLPYLQALKEIDLNRYRLLDDKRVLKFESGVEIQLLSGQELAAEKGEPVVSNLTAKADFQNNTGMILQLHSSGRILEKHFKRVVK